MRIPYLNAGYATNFFLCSSGVCNSPPDMENASHNGGGGSAFQEDEKVVYTCNAGYRSSDNGATICESNGEWYPSDFQYTCRRKC